MRGSGSAARANGGRPRRRRALLPGLALAAACAGAPAPPEPFAVGDRIPPFALEDPHGARHRVDESVRLLVVSRDMDADAVVDAVLAEAPEGFLAARDAAYVADISGMPGLVSRLFAIPRLRERSYPMLLDREGDATARVPAKEGEATLLLLRGLEVERVLHRADPAALRRALERGAGAPPAAPTPDAKVRPGS